MSTAKEQRQALRRLDEAKEEVVVAQWGVFAWWVAALGWFVIIVGAAVMQFYMDAPIAMVTIMGGIFGGAGLYFWGFDTHNAGFQRLGRARKGVRNATYDWEDLTLENL